eukprot:TRINITY_DN65570_c0_g1_i1.p1 TRINITY_DN65570_c0_g1~~TRINITY_DN65570_c0_g1_i1.p1  ORF type:complete len:573 (+),score=96.16 TRINITY_DN65570_c0_g1_i1:84-1802(+)
MHRFSKTLRIWELLLAVCTQPCLPFRGPPLLGDQLDAASHDTDDVLFGSEGFRVFSDLDDTLKCSYHGGMAGMDNNCNEHGEIYPGAIQFMLELSRGPHEGAVISPPKVVPLSARPEMLRHVLSIKESDPLNQAFRALAENQGVPDWGLDLEGAQYGSLRTSLTVLTGRVEKGLSQKKFDGWEKFQRRYGTTEPTFFVGDNGQGDVYAAELMLAKQVGTVFDHFDLGEGKWNVDTYKRFMGSCGHDVSETASNGGSVCHTCGLDADWTKLQDRDEQNAPTGSMSKGSMVAHLELSAKTQSCADKWARQLSKPYLLAAFVHHVQHKPMLGKLLETAPASGRAGGWQRLEKKGIVLFLQYGQAACKAYKYGYISAAGYARVMQSVLSECFSSADAKSRNACHATLNEFELAEDSTDDPQAVIRNADDCDKPYQVRTKDGPAPGALGGLDPFSFFMQYGYWSVRRKCSEIDATMSEAFFQGGILSRLAMASAFIDSAGSQTLALDAGVPYSSYRILKADGLHCLSRCGFSCEEEELKDPAFSGRFLQTDAADSAGAQNSSARKWALKEIVTEVGQ